LNTTHETPCSYYNTWNQCHLTFTEFDNPFTNLVSGATISLRGIGTGATTLGSSDVYETISSPSPFDITMRINEDTTYVPPFNLSTIKDHTILNWHTFITPFGSSEPQVNNYTIPEGNFNIVGWEDLELKQSPLGWTRIMRIYLPNLATADYDYVITNLVLALDNINPLEGKAELYASESTYSTAAAAAHTALLAKFDITDGGLAQ